MPDPAAASGGGGSPPGGAPGAAMPAQPGPGTGAGPATQPVANRGIQAAALARIGNVVQMLHMIAAALGPGHEAEKAVMTAITSLSKAVPPGAASEGLMRADLQKLAMQQRQNTGNVMAMRGAGGAQPAPQPAMGA